MAWKGFGYFSPREAGGNLLNATYMGGVISIVSTQATFNLNIGDDYIRNQTAIAEPKSFRINGSGTLNILTISGVADLGSHPTRIAVFDANNRVFFRNTSDYLTAANVSFNNVATDFTATTVQAALVELDNEKQDLLTFDLVPTDGSLNPVFSNGIFDALATKQPLDATLTALAAYNTNGILTQTATDTFVGRTIVSGSANVTITNGDGVGGNPTISVAEFNQPATTKATATNTVTTGSATPVLLNDMTLSPPSGTYQVNFNTTLTSSSANATITVSIFVNGSQIASSVRRAQPNSNVGLLGIVGSLNIPIPIGISDEVTVTAGQAIEIRWQTTAATATATQRGMIINRVR